MSHISIFLDIALGNVHTVKSWEPKIYNIIIMVACILSVGSQDALNKTKKRSLGDPECKLVILTLSVCKSKMLFYREYTSY